MLTTHVWCSSSRMSSACGGGGSGTVKKMVGNGIREGEKRKRRVSEEGEVDGQGKGLSGKGVNGMLLSFTWWAMVGLEGICKRRDSAAGVIGNLVAMKANGLEYAVDGL